MKAIINDVDNSFEGKRKVVNVSASKKEFCRILGCEWCLKSEISVENHRFGLVYPKDRINRGRQDVSMISTLGAPDFCGSYLLFGLDAAGQLTDLSDKEIDILMRNFSLDKREFGRGKYVLYNVDI